MAINLIKICAYEMDLSKESLDTRANLISLNTLTREVISFFEDHIEGALNTRQIKSCVFVNDQATVLKDCEQLAVNLTSNQLFIDLSIHMTQSLFNFMKSSSSRSSGTLIFIHYYNSNTGLNYLAVMKMDQNKGIQLDRNNNTFIVQEDMLPSINEKLHKCAFIKLQQNLINQDVHLFVLDKQQKVDKRTKFFMDLFLESKEKINHAKMTQIVETTLREYATDEKQLFESRKERLEFGRKVDQLLSTKKDIDIDRDLEDIFKPYSEGEGDLNELIDGYKTYLRGKDEDVSFQFNVAKTTTYKTFTDEQKQIKIHFPIGLLNTKVFYEEDEEGNIIFTIRGGLTEIN